MKAYICTKFGPPKVLKLKDVEKPIPKDNEVLIEVKATTVNAADCNLRGQTFIPSGMGFIAKLMLGFNKPKIPIQGSVLAGIVVETGKNVKLFKLGDRVFGTGFELGAYGEFACRSESGALSIIPDNISFEEAASVPYGALTAYYFLVDMAKVKKNQKVLIKGASGGVGVYAVQIAKYFGAEVTGVCSTSNIDFVKSLGADKTIDYTKENYLESKEKWDIVLDVVVKNTSFAKNKKVLNKGGLYLAVAGGLNDMFQMLITSISGSKKVKFGGGSDCEKRSNLDFIANSLKEGKIKPVVDKVFSFEEMVNAHKYEESGNKRGNVVVSF